MFLEIPYPFQATEETIVGLQGGLFRPRGRLVELLEFELDRISAEFIHQLLPNVSKILDQSYST